MSNLRQFTSGIKSIQRGTISATNASSSTVTVTSVDTSKSELIVSVSSGFAWYSGSSVGNATVGNAVLTNSTTITWTGGERYAAITSDVAGKIFWQLVEYK